MTNSTIDPDLPISDHAWKVICVTKDERGLSNAELARRVGVDRATIGRIANRSQRSAKASTLTAIAKALDVPFQELGIEAPGVQHELEFQVDDVFIAAAHMALDVELSRLRAEVGTVTAVGAVGVVGIEFHGRESTRKIYRAAFPIRMKQAG